MPSQQFSSTPTRLLRKRAVCERVQLSPTTIWRLQRAGQFPKSIRISAGAVAWREADIDEWFAERAADAGAVVGVDQSPDDLPVKTHGSSRRHAGRSPEHRS